ncbi:MAG: hypothetical protein ACLUUU_03585 [Mediterraneibacter faecis]
MRDGTLLNKKKTPNKKNSKQEKLQTRKTPNKKKPLQTRKNTNKQEKHLSSNGNAFQTRGIFRSNVKVYKW